MGTQNNSNSAELGLDIFSRRCVQSIEKQYEKLNKLLKKLQDAHEESKAVTKQSSSVWRKMWMKFERLLGLLNQKLRNLTRRTWQADRGVDVERELKLTGSNIKNIVRWLS
uniref:Uncharacterized protein n=1 Tax=Lactuca sativa TaxID=4236 RepID=A0A9R1WHQ4_LACSA|nr:hypothetical protein LSAT_V11C100022950 [Lactuca sativa]